jgi:hypothetical protein
MLLHTGLCSELFERTHFHSPISKLLLDAHKESVARFGCRTLIQMEERAMPTAKQACKFISDVIAILFECRILAAELVFTAAAFYGLYHVFRVLTR